MHQIGMIHYRRQCDTSSKKPICGCMGKWKVFSHTHTWMKAFGTFHIEILEISVVFRSSTEKLDKKYPVKWNWFQPVKPSLITSLQNWLRSGFEFVRLFFKFVLLEFAVVCEMTASYSKLDHISNFLH